jgi:coenzyme F420-0:L-glutamate ligase / coenzyme F420-1:gamma-L-glutamate ligase
MDARGEAAVAQVSVLGLRYDGEIRPGDDLAANVIEAAERAGTTLRDSDVLVVTHKAVAKAEGRLLDLRTVEPSELARHYADRWGRDPRQIEVVLRESARVIRMDRGLIIAQTQHGFICANAGVDQSNVEGADVVCLLPVDPDASAARLRSGLAERSGADCAVIVSDSFGRPWRLGIVNVAIGVAGLLPLIDYRGQPDDNGRMMNATVMAVADELAAASELVTGKVQRCPFALIRGYQIVRGEGSVRDMIMDQSMDMFR